MGLQQWEKRWGHPRRSPTNQKSKARVPVSPPRPSLQTHAHTSDTLTTLSTPQWGSHSRPSGAPRELGRGLSP